MDVVNAAIVSSVIKLKQNSGSVSPKCKEKCGFKRKTTPRDDAYSDIVKRFTQNERRIKYGFEGEVYPNQIPLQFADSHYSWSTNQTTS